MGKVTQLSHRSMLKTAGARVVSVGMPIGLDAVLGIGEGFAQGSNNLLTPDELSSYMSILPKKADTLPSALTAM